MKQIIQSYKTGEVSLRDVPVPHCGSKRILVRTQHSLISIGTERATIELGRKSLLGKAAARPDLVRRAWAKAKKEGLLKTWQEAMGRLDTPTPLGYSSAGVVEQCGNEATEFAPADRVACIGQGFASHAQFVSVPVNLACKIPTNVSDEEASFGMLGVIALHGVRSANLSFGSKVVVMGLGLLGLLTIQMLRAYGCEVIAFDPSLGKVDLARRLRFTNVTHVAEELNLLSDTQSTGHGVDAVIITAASKDRGPIDHAIQLCRQKGRIVVVGTADIHPDRNELWQKEVELVVSKAAGPGSLDPLYEIEGIDLPIGDVRWTQKRNLQEFLRLLSDKKVDVLSLVTHRFSIEKAQDAYSQFVAGTLLNPIGMLLEYPDDAKLDKTLSFPSVSSQPKQLSHASIGISVIGAGLFAKALLLPALAAQKNINRHTLVTGSGSSVEHTAGKFGFSHYSTDAQVVWSNPEIDAVIGLTPHSHHASLVESAIQHHKSLFLEKPLCTTEEELKQLRELASAATSLPVIFVGHNRRYSPHTTRMREWLSNRQSPCVLNMRVNAGFIPSSHWVHSADQGRSRIVGEMSHFLDLIQTLTNAQIIRVYAERVSGNNQNIINNDNLVVSLKLSDGSVGSLTYSASGDKAYSREFLEIFFDGKTIASQDFKTSTLYSQGKSESFKTRGQEMGYLQELEYFLACARGDKAPDVSPQSIFATMQAIFSVERSLNQAQPIAMDAV